MFLDQHSSYLFTLHPPSDVGKIRKLIVVRCTVVDACSHGIVVKRRPGDVSNAHYALNIECTYGMHKSSVV